VELSEALEEDAWAAVHEALPARWQVGPVTYDPGRHAWSVTARSGARGRGNPPVTVSGAGEDEIAALRDLDDRLRGVPKPDGTRMDELRRRARFVFVQSAEETWQRIEGRPMTAEELSRVIQRMPRAGR